MQSLICTYQHRNRIISREGRGRDFADALRDADGKLPDGDWRRICVSNPATIRSDLAGDGGRVPGEGETVSVSRVVR